MSYGVVQRTREFGIRMAIGAGANSILRLVLREAMWLLLAGAGFGLAASWFLGRIVRSLLFGIEATDGVSMAVAGGRARRGGSLPPRAFPHGVPRRSIPSVLCVRSERWPCAHVALVSSREEVQNPDEAHMRQSGLS